MIENFPLAQANHYLWERQGFAWNQPPALENIFGIYSTAPTCYLSLMARDGGFRLADLDMALNEKREAARIRAMRYSAFIIPIAHLPAAYQATKDRALANRWKLGKLASITEEQYSELVQAILDLLDQQDMTVSEIKKALPIREFISTPTLNYVIPFMNAEGRLLRAKVRGGWRSDLYEYARFDRWLPQVNLNEVTPEQGRVSLAHLYFDSYAPASAGDFQWWSGFTKADSLGAIAALGDELAPVQVEGKDYLMPVARMDQLRGCPSELPQGVRLLPVWDAYLMAYKDRARYLADKDYEYVYDKVGNATSTVLLNGSLGGVWDIQEEKKQLTLKFALFEKSTKKIEKAFEGELIRLAEATGYTSAALVRCEAPLPLRGGSQNMFMSPLKDVGGETIFSLS